jgi:ABC-type polar amino acid transport system ATPase subunit
VVTRPEEVQRNLHNLFWKLRDGVVILVIVTHNEELLREMADRKLIGMQMVLIVKYVA